MGITLAAFTTLKALFSKATEIYHKTVEEINSLDPKTVPPGYLEQANLQLGRLDPEHGTAACELGMIPGFGSFPSKSPLHYVSLV
jgi:hypothetical protein